MAAFQVIEEKGTPKFVVLPFGDQAAFEDYENYLERQWAEKALKAFQARKNKRFYDLEEVRQELGIAGGAMCAHEPKVEYTTNRAKKEKRSTKSRTPVNPVKKRKK